MMSTTLESILAPASIAIVGASNDAGKRGNMAIRYLQENQYQGDIYPVHPRETRIRNLDCFASIEQLPETPDLALICTPAQTLPEIIYSCGIKGIKGAVVLATGFSETGHTGADLERKMIQAAKESGLRIIGPNTSGIFNARCGVNLVGYRDLQPGTIGLLSQSGNMALSLVTEGSQNEYVGFSTYIGVGNEADIQFHEYLDYFRTDKDTRVIVSYIEGLKGGRDFLQAAAQVCREKPVVVYKSGRTAIGRQTAKSHTGALAGSYNMAKNVMRQAGITLVERADEILPIAETFSLLSPLLPLRGRRVAVLADGGGHAAIAADSLDAIGINIPPLAKQTQMNLQQLLPSGAAITNPVDVAGGTDNNPYLFAECAEQLLQDPDIDALFVVGLFGGYALRFNETLLAKELVCVERLTELVAQTGKPVFVQSLYQTRAPQPLVNLRRAGIPVFQSIDVAVACMASVFDYSESRLRLCHQCSADTLLPYAESVDELIAAALSQNRNALYEHEALAVLAGYHIETVRPVILRSGEEVTAFARTGNQQRWVMKIISRDILHKTDAGGVMLNLDTAGLSGAYTQIMDNARRYDPQADIYGVLLVPMAEPGIEVIIGVVNDDQYGPVMMFGLGGIFVEVLKDVVFRSLPVTSTDARDMLTEIAGSHLLSGARGQSGINVDALVQLMTAVSSLCLNHPEIDELDLNPVLAREHDYCILDARIILNTSKGSGDE